MLLTNPLLPLLELGFYCIFLLAYQYLLLFYRPHITTHPLLLQNLVSEVNTLNLQLTSNELCITSSDWHDIFKHNQLTILHFIANVLNDFSKTEGPMQRLINKELISRVLRL
ncbi:hypothetical protein BCV72DRAFT_236666 [Rhizopus microsporus var. microsporus]|uniref:Uncharacterized protein n=2 Tax=Rhizopus microsporus TaxID=58291 RepID=A0A2G4SYJ7_RHIZD|nr:uncharacterized protein RHIMIDRAFT_280534 [Rhizopus microsporus ATCC 52813]ORE01317.1 hypothetical protein BCV72DRAFT_236666 [Rhizopus microsporus var. microsporus]PHZ13814.1 hypothetical protein RHIMIDRAFT_280534 [Rhizopus microsporus ATCC 52813]